jgi:hypothetical protein
MAVRFSRIRRAAGQPGQRGGERPGIERATHAVHYVDGKHSATRIHPELQEVKVGDRLNTGSFGEEVEIGAPLAIVEPNHALVAGTWAFVLEPGPNGTTRFFMRGRYAGWLRQAAPKHSGLLRLLGGGIDCLFGEPLHSSWSAR